jgi:hypothetical protein
MNQEDHQYGDVGQQRAGTGTGIGSLMWLLAEMFRFPLTIFVSTIEVFTNSMRGIQRSTDRVIDTTVGGMIQSPGQSVRRATPPSDSIEIRKYDTLTTSVELKDQHQKEQSEMEDIDLRGDDLKLVEYDIWFTKADLEAYLAEGKEVVTYSTTLGDYRGARISKYLKRLRGEGGRPPEPGERSQKWLDNDYPPPEYRADEDGTQNNDGAYFIDLPQDDIDEHLKVDVRIKGRRSKNEKDESDRLKDINKTLRGTLTVRQI